MKKLIVASVTCVALADGHTALAADMLTKPIPPALALNWTGCYIGGNVGYGVGLDESIEFRGSFWDGFFSTNQFPRSIPVNLKGVIGGGQIGCNLQIQQWVVGVEADLQGTQIKGSNTLTPTPAAGAPFVTTGSENRRRFGTVRARVGLLARPQAVLYATGGFAYGETELNFDTRVIVGPGANCTLNFTCAAATSSGTNTGWTAGAGLEWMLAGNWSVRAEYLYVDLGSRSVTGVTLPSAMPAQTFTATAAFREHITRVGVNYTFNWGSAAQPY